MVGFFLPRTWQLVAAAAAAATTLNFTYLECASHNISLRGMTEVVIAGLQQAKRIFGLAANFAAVINTLYDRSFCHLDHGVADLSLCCEAMIQKKGS